MAKKTKDEKPQKKVSPPADGETKPFYKHVPLMAATAASVLVLLVVGYFAFQSTNQSSESNTEENLTEEEKEFNRLVEEAEFGPTQEEIASQTPVKEAEVKEAIGTKQEAHKRYELAKQYIYVGEYKKAKAENEAALDLARASNNSNLIEVLEIQKLNISDYLLLIESSGE